MPPSSKYFLPQNLLKAKLTSQMLISYEFSFLPSPSTYNVFPFPVRYWNSAHNLPTFTIKIGIQVSLQSFIRGKCI